MEIINFNLILSMKISPLFGFTEKRAYLHMVQALAVIMGGGMGLPLVQKEIIRQDMQGTGNLG